MHPTAQTQEGKSLEERTYRAIQRIRDPLLRPLVALLSRFGVTPGALTLAGIACMGGFVALVGRDSWLALALLVAAVLIDALDGNLARYLGTSSDAGKFTDVLADNVCFTLFLIGVSMIGLLSAPVGIAYAYTMLLAKVLMVVRKNAALPSDWLIRPMVGAFPNVLVFASYGLFALYAVAGLAYLEISSALFAAMLSVQTLVSYVAVTRIVVRAGSASDRDASAPTPRT